MKSLYFISSTTAVACLLLYLALINFGTLGVLLSLALTVATLAASKIYFDRMARQTREATARARLHLATVEALATAIDAKDQTTHCHVRRVQIYATGMARALNLSAPEIEALSAGAMLHDIGKLAVPDHILNKPGELTPAEFERMKLHTTVGAQILENIDFPYPVVSVVRYHHERWDGSGYPEGLCGEAIPQTARIFAVVDGFDSVREARPFRGGQTVEEASALLRREAGTHFDPQLVELFLQRLPEFEREITARGLNQHGAANSPAPPRAPDDAHEEGEEEHATPGHPPAAATATPPAYLEQIKNAHREVYTLYQIASTFGSSLDIKCRAQILVDKIGHLVPFDTCAVYLYDESRSIARVAHAAGAHAELLLDRTVAPGEGVIGFVLANRLPATDSDPLPDFAALGLPVNAPAYRSMLALPLVKGGRLLGALAVYSAELPRYTEDHRRLLDTIATLATDAFANALHHAETESNALTDALTNLPNARALTMRFGEEEARARRTGSSFQLVMLDLDEFKQVNDTFGHPVGDQMLREVARLMQAQLREYDFLARYAGDEFVAIVQELSSEQVADLCRRIEQAVEQFSLPVTPDGASASVGISAGAALYGAEGETLSHLLTAADQAMYSVKSKHRQQKYSAHDLPTEASESDFTSTAIN
ncbi:MAG: diguanylate cyclase [Pyrinomonadaceae bacterium]|nr:diguanylate cyclase [Pyrinomonadaceae bacterium]